MSWIKGFILVSVLALPLTATPLAGASAAETATDTKPTTTPKKPTKDQLTAYEAKCSNEANEKGLTLKKGKGEERKTFRAGCIKKLIGE